MRLRSSKTRFWLAMAMLGLVGAGLLILAATTALPGALHDLVPALGSALVIAAVLGATVDQFLKRRLLEDAFHVLFGYLLPPELREELSWITKQEVLCERHELRLTLTLLDDALVKVHMESERDLRNITSHLVPFPIHFAVDEWFHEGLPSQVISLRCTQGSTLLEGEPPDALPQDCSPFIRALQVSVGLEPGEGATVVAEAEETRRVSDAWFLNVPVATASPRVTVRVPDGIDYRVTFGSGQALRVREIGPHTRELPGTLLPGQIIQVRWWPAAGVP
jgi:hypothetical protein